MTFHCTNTLILFLKNHRKKKKKYYESSSYPKLNPNEEGKNLAECVSRLIELTVQCTDVVVPRLATRRMHVRNFESPPIT